MEKTPPATLTNNGVTCRTCANLRITMAEGSALAYQCVANPPMPVAAAQVSPKGEVRWIANAFFPPIGDPDAIWCGHHIMRNEFPH